MEFEKCVVCEKQIPFFFFHSAAEERVIFACATADLLCLTVQNTQFWKRYKNTHLKDHSIHIFFLLLEQGVIIKVIFDNTYLAKGALNLTEYFC